MMTSITDGVLEIKSETYPVNEKLIRRKSDGFVFGCVVYANANRHTASDFEEVDISEIPPEEIEYLL